MLCPYRVADYIFRIFQSQGHPYTIKGFLHNLETLARLAIPPPFLLDQLRYDSAPRRALHIRVMRRGVPGKTKGQRCSGEGFENIEPGELGGTQEGECGKHNTCASADPMTRTALLQGGDRLETRVVSVCAQVRRCLLPQRSSGDCHPLDAQREHHRVFG